MRNDPEVAEALAAAGIVLDKRQPHHGVTRNDHLTEADKLIGFASSSWKMGLSDEWWRKDLDKAVARINQCEDGLLQEEAVALLNELNDQRTKLNLIMAGFAERRARGRGDDNAGHWTEYQALERLNDAADALHEASEFMPGPHGQVAKDLLNRLGDFIGDVDAEIGQ